MGTLFRSTYNFDLEILILSSLFSFTTANIAATITQIRTVTFNSLFIKGLSSFQALNFSATSTVKNILNEILIINNIFIKVTGTLIIPFGREIQTNTYTILRLNHCQLLFSTNKIVNNSCKSYSSAIITDLKAYVVNSNFTLNLNTGIKNLFYIKVSL